MKRICIWCAYCFVIPLPAYALVTWNNTTNISGIITQDVVITGGVNELSGNTTIQADGVDVTVTGSATLKARNQEELVFEADNGGTVTLVFQSSDQLVLDDSIVMRMPHAITIDVGPGGQLIARNQAQIAFA